MPGGGAVPDPKKFFAPQSGKENYFGFLGGLGACPLENFLNKGSNIG